MYRIIIESFQKECSDKFQATDLAATLLNSGLFFINVDEVKKGKGEAVPTVFVKKQFVMEETLADAAETLMLLGKASVHYGVDINLQLKPEN